MILCTACGHELPDNSRFCGYCGAKVNPQTTSSAQEHPADAKPAAGHTMFGMSAITLDDVPSNIVHDNENLNDKTNEPPAPNKEDIIIKADEACNNTPDADSHSTMGSTPSQSELLTFAALTPVSRDDAVSGSLQNTNEKTAKSDDEAHGSDIVSAFETGSDSEGPERSHKITQTQKLTGTAQDTGKPTMAVLSAIVPESDISQSHTDSSIPTSSDGALNSLNNLSALLGDDSDDDIFSLSDTSAQSLDIPKPDSLMPSSESKDAHSVTEENGPDEEDDEITALERQLAELKAKKEEKAKREAEELAKKEAEEKAKREAEELAKKEAEEIAKREAEEKAKREAEEKAKREAEEKAKKEAEELAKKEAEEKAKREAEEKAKREAEELAKREAEELAKREAEDLTKKEAEEKAKKEAEEPTATPSLEKSDTPKKKGKKKKKSKSEASRLANSTDSKPINDTSVDSASSKDATSSMDDDESEKRVQAEALKKLELAAAKSKEENDGDTFEIMGAETAAPTDDTLDDDEDFEDDFDESNETDFFNGRMSQQFVVDPEIMNSKKKGSKKTIILAVIFAVVVLALILVFVLGD